jgi:hypothetical protein
MSSLSVPFNRLAYFLEHPKLIAISDLRNWDASCKKVTRELLVRRAKFAFNACSGPEQGLNLGEILRLDAGPFGAGPFGAGLFERPEHIADLNMH